KCDRVCPGENNRVAALESKWAGRPVACLPACRKNSRPNTYTSHGQDLADAGRAFSARAGCGSLASCITRTKDSAIGAEDLCSSRIAHGRDLLRLQACQSAVRQQ